MSELNRTEADTVAELAPKPFIEVIEGVPYLLMPSGGGAWKHAALPELLPAPLRKTGKVEIHEVDSFIEFSKKHGSLTNSNIYLDVDYVKQTLLATAIFNDHSDEAAAGWQDHRAVFHPRIGEEWRRWNLANKQAMTQETFANFLQDNIGDINAGGDERLPNGSDILTFVSKLEETRTVRFGSGLNTQNGMVQLEYTEEGDDNTKGKLELFKEFGLGLRPFFGGEPYAVRALLRYRIDRNTREIKFWFELQRPDRVLEDACKELIAKINTETGFPVVFGAAP